MSSQDFEYQFRLRHTSTMLLYSRNHYTQQENPSVKSTQMIESIILPNTNIMPPLYNIPGADPASEERGCEGWGHAKYRHYDNKKIHSP